MAMVNLEASPVFLRLPTDGTPPILGFQHSIPGISGETITAEEVPIGGRLPSFFPMN